MLCVCSSGSGRIFIYDEHNQVTQIVLGTTNVCEFACLLGILSFHQFSLAISNSKQLSVDLNGSDFGLFYLTELKFNGN